MGKLASTQQRRSELASRPQVGEFNADEAMGVQEKVNGLNEQLTTLKYSIAGKQRERLKVNLTKGNLDELPAETRIYRAVGRCFMQERREAIDESLTGAVESLDAEIPKMTKAYEELEKRKDEAEKELKEMIQAYKGQMERSGAAGAA